MRLYYYTAKQWGMKSLWERRLKIAQYAELNDPFELLPFRQDDKEARTHIRMVEKILSDSHGVLCFSESWRSTLMWAHYGDKHSGLCLGFDIDVGPHLTKIEYVAGRLDCPIDLSKPLKGIDQDMLERCLIVKHSGWEYEKEHRLRVELQDRRDGIYYYPFNASVTLREVIIGARSSLSIVDVAEAIGNEPESSVEIWTARAAHASFSMCVDLTKPKESILGVTDEVKHARRLAQALRQ